MHDMKMYASCSGECCLCSAGHACSAYQGYDDFSLATKDQLIKRLNDGEYPLCTDRMKEYLLKVYDYDYDKEYSKAVSRGQLKKEDSTPREESLVTVTINGIKLVHKEY